MKCESVGPDPMFSLRMQEQRQPVSKPATVSQQLFGKLLGFTAGLILIVFADAVVLDHAIWRSVLGGFARSYPSADHAITAFWITLFGR